MLEKEFVPFEEALELKELGFDEPCCAFYQVEYAESRPIMVDDNEQYRLTGFRTCKNSEIPEHYTSAPTFSQTFRWFRDKGYEVFPKKTENNEYYYTIEYGHWTFIMDDKYYSYEEAELACLKQLIRMLKSNNDSRK